MRELPDSAPFEDLRIDTAAVHCHDGAGRHVRGWAAWAASSRTYRFARRARQSALRADRAGYVPARVAARSAVWWAFRTSHSATSTLGTHAVQANHG